MNSDAMNLSANVRAARQVLNVSQEELAAALTDTGVPTTQSAISRLEAGRREPGLTEIRAIANAFHLPLEALILDPEDFARVIPWMRVHNRYDCAAFELIMAAKSYTNACMELNAFRASDAETAQIVATPDWVPETLLDALDLLEEKRSFWDSRLDHDGEKGS